MAGIYILDKPNLQWYVAEYATLPSGDYHNDQTVNLGNNRCAFKTETGIGWKPTQKLSLELLASAELYTKNDDYNMGNELKKDPYYGVWGHITYNVTPTLYFAVSPFYWWGGASEVNGRDVANSKVETWQGMFTTGVNITPTTQLLVQAIHDFDVKNGFAQDAIRLRWAYFF